MGLARSLSFQPALLAQLHQQEVVRRSRQGYSKDCIAASMRYGAPLGHFLEHHVCLSRCVERLESLLHDCVGRGVSLPSGFVVMADRLEAGRGRFTRDWHAPVGGVWLAFVWSDCLLPLQARLLPLAVGVACCEALRDSGADARIKWVNDVHVAGRKIAGVLGTTLRSGPAGENMHCFGIGININNSAFPSELQDNATSLRLVLGEEQDLNRFRACLLVKLRWNLGLLHWQEALALAAAGNGRDEDAATPVLDAWRALADTIGRRVEYGFDVWREPQYSGRAIALDRAGGLVLEQEDGSLITEYAGELRYLE